MVRNFPEQKRIQSAVHLVKVERSGRAPLRHSAVAAMLASGAHLNLMSAILGHSSASTTANIYGHTSEEAQRAVLDALHEKVTENRSSRQR